MRGKCYWGLRCTIETVLERTVERVFSWRFGGRIKEVILEKIDGKHEGVASKRVKAVEKGVQG